MADVIKTSDLIQDDGSLDRIADKLDHAADSLESLEKMAKNSASSVAEGLKSISSASIGSAEKIDIAADATARLQKLQRELAMALSQTGQMCAVLRSTISDVNKETVLQNKQLSAAEGSYDALNLKLKQLVAQYKAMSEEERNNAVTGEVLLQNIRELREQMTQINSQLKNQVTTLSAVQKAEEKLAFLQSEEGKRLIQLNAQIREAQKQRKEEASAISAIEKAEKDLAYAQSEEYQKLVLLNQEKDKAQRIAKLTAQVNSSSVGSYQYLSAVYELNKIKLNEMSAAERTGTQAGKDLEQETKAIYREMVKLQEATGNYRLSVGNYKLAWNGLGMAMNQVIRELPSMAVSMNTFFLAISNNVPILIDEIEKVRQKNKLLAQEGKQGTSVMKTITGAIFSWQSALVLLLTALSMNGQAILDWIGNLFSGGRAVKSFSEIVKNAREELAKTNASYGDNVVTLKKLQEEYINLKREGGNVNQFIRDHKSEFDKLEASVTNVNDVENLLINNTDAMVQALQARAMAAAAMKLASDEYTNALQKQIEAEMYGYEYEYQTDPKTGKLKAVKVKSKAPQTYGGGLTGMYIGQSPSAYGIRLNVPYVGKDAEKAWEEDNKRRIEGLEKEAAAAEADADAYFKLANAYFAKENEIYKKYGFDRPHKPLKKQKTKKEPKGAQPKNVEDRVWRNDLSIRKKYEIAITELMRDEYQKRRIEATDAANRTIRELQEKYRKNEEYLANKDKKYIVSPEVRKEIEQQQKEILATVENINAKLQLDLTEIDQQAEMERLQNMRYFHKYKLKNLENDLEEEKDLAIHNLDEIEQAYASAQRKIAYVENLKQRDMEIKGGSSDSMQMKRVVAGEDAYSLDAKTAYELSETEIKALELTDEQRAKIRKKRLQIEAKYDKMIYSLRKERIDAEIEQVKKGTEEEINLLIERNKIAMELALAENKAKPVEQQLDEETIRSLYTKRGLLLRGSNTMQRFDEEQKMNKAHFEEIKNNAYEITLFELQQEKARWEKQIELAEKGSLDWSQAQIEAAKATVKGINREIEEHTNFLGRASERGFGGALLERFGFDDDTIDALSNAANIVIDNIKNVIDAEVELAETMVEIAERRVDAAKSAYEAEIEARNNGYANNVATAKKELQQEKKNQMQKQKLLEAAQKRQEAVDTAMQISSLVTATANLWKSYSSMGPASVGLAIAATAAMWSSFAYAKIKAAALSKSKTELEENYGEGGLEILEGGSHASGNDINLHTKNSRGRNMRAEGGEAMAIINKRNTRKYKKVLPGIIDSLNKGVFEEKYLRAFSKGEILQAQISANSNLDLSRLENGVEAIKKQNEEKFYMLGNGVTLVVKNNVKRYIR